MKRPNRALFKEGHLVPDAAPGSVFTEGATGKQALGLDTKRDGWIYIPSAYKAAVPLPLIVLLHGAGGSADHGLDLLQTYADDHQLILLAPSSRAGTWDILVENEFGKDLFFMNEALSQTFRLYSIDPKRLAIVGFSDGASYALCVGLTNGYLFTHIIAFSPGFAYAPAPQGRPAIFVSHGTKDGILPIDRCSRKVVPRLQDQGYPINYLEFNDEHVVPNDIKKGAIHWFLND